MEAQAEKIVLARSQCAGESVHTSRMHHRHFPELWVECESPIAAANHLRNQLVRAIDSVSGTHARQAFESAIAEVEAFEEDLRASATEEEFSEEAPLEPGSSIGHRIGGLSGRVMPAKPHRHNPNG